MFIIYNNEDPLTQGLTPIVTIYQVYGRNEAAKITPDLPLYTIIIASVSGPGIPARCHICNNNEDPLTQGLTPISKTYQV